MVANSTDRRTDAPLALSWNTVADSCTPSGGAPGDGWANKQFGPFNSRFWATGLPLGTFTYRLTCTSGPLSAQAEVTVHVENDPLYATLVADVATVAIGEAVTLSWKSNGNCNPPNIPYTPTGAAGGDAEGSLTFKPTRAETLHIVLNCGLFGHSENYDPPPVDITVVQGISENFFTNNLAVKTGESFSLNWNVDGASSCTGSGGGADGSMWSGSVALPSGSKSISATTVGTFTYSLDCVGLLPRLTQHKEQTVTVTAAPPPAGGGNGNASGGSGGGGGGAFDWLSLLAIALIGTCKAAAVRVDGARAPQRIIQKRHCARPPRFHAGSWRP
jgi:hypothetical protein